MTNLPNPFEWYTLDEASAILKVHKGQLFKLRRAGLIQSSSPHSMSGPGAHTVRISGSELLRFLTERTQVGNTITTAPIEQPGV